MQVERASLLELRRVAGLSLGSNQRIELSDDDDNRQHMGRTFYAEANCKVAKVVWQVIRFGEI
jgi:hypothetical protein